MTETPTDSNPMSPLISVLLFVVCGCLFFSGCAFAHGGVSIEDDACIMTVGTYRAHFSGYQPELRASQEFCEDIPAASDAIIVLDFISNALRDMSIDFRIIRDVNNIGVKATYEDLGSQEAIEAATVTYVPAKQYLTGNFSVDLTFDQPGRFIGILSATQSTNNQTYYSVFPFSVGITDWRTPIVWLIVVLVVGGIAYFFGLRKS